ncbi:MAG: 30S ribosomal protein S16 [Myxococcales bacterium]|nr:30S ribosomal protein S16 [Myxococcales bacterium]MCB9531643.1 30S ribosomal protein S16 [Myxococcales bacterium]MCB9534222.1 30S ribosomal protein S16 [Myxococcales bacterium]
MSVRLRLQRSGAKKRPFYRIVAADIRSPRDGRYCEQVGTIDPMHEPNVVDLKLDRVDYWLGVGAQPTDRVKHIIDGYKAGKYISNAAFAEHNRARRKASQEGALLAKAVEMPAAPTSAPVQEPAADEPAADEAEA